MEETYRLSRQRSRVNSDNPVIQKTQIHVKNPFKTKLIAKPLKDTQNSVINLFFDHFDVNKTI